MRLFLALIILFMTSFSSFAVNPDEVLSDPALEKRARSLSTDLRCLVCQNQSIDDSDAQLAKDLRILVRERLTAGDTDKQVIDYIVARYGEFVLLKPRFAGHTLILWLSPFVILLIGMIAVIWWLKTRQSIAPPNLSSEEEKALEELLDRQK